MTNPTHRLAATLCVADRIQDPAEAEKVGRGVLRIRGAEYRASWERQAAAIMRHLGLIAPPPELVETYRRHFDPEAAVTLADAILEQMVKR